MSTQAAPSRVFGSLDSFDPKAVEWELYETQFDFFLQANGITDAKQKRALLLSTIGMGALSYVRDLNMPVALNADATTYDILIEQLRNHYGKKTAVLAGRSDFTNIRQQEAQSVEEFAASLRAASIFCKFGAYLDIRLRDQFVIGLKTDSIRKRLMENDDITFAEALKQASDLERIAHDSKLVGRNETSVSQVQKKPDHRGSDHQSSEPRQFEPNNGIVKVLNSTINTHLNAKVLVHQIQDSVLVEVVVRIIDVLTANILSTI